MLSSGKPATCIYLVEIHNSRKQIIEYKNTQESLTDKTYSIFKQNTNAVTQI